jgi:hypothetical protein
MTTLPTTTTTPPAAACGDPVEPSASAGATAATGSRLITATDALFVLEAAVGLETCDPCVCDPSGDGSVSATDALIVLRAAVGIPQELGCPPCGG